MLIALIEDRMQDLLTLDIAQQVFNPQLLSYFLIKVLIIFRQGHQDDLLEGVAQMFLIIMERRVLKFRDLLLFVLINSLNLRENRRSHAFICW